MTLRKGLQNSHLQLLLQKLIGNLDELELWVNGESKGKKKADMGVYLWENIKLKPDKNHILIKPKANGNVFEDQIVNDIISFILHENTQLTSSNALNSLVGT